MELAIIEDGVVTRIAHHIELFPNTSFAACGPDDDFCASVGVLRVDNALVPSPIQKLIDVPAYIDGSVVRTTMLVDKTQEEIDAEEATRKKIVIQRFSDEATDRLNAWAKARGYGSLISVCTYEGSSIQRYAVDAVRARTLRDQWWEALNVIMADVLAGTRPEPTSFDELLPELPVLSWS